MLELVEALELDCSGLGMNTGSRAGFNELLSLVVSDELAGIDLLDSDEELETGVGVIGLDLELSEVELLEELV